MELFSRTKAILFNPKEEWQVIEAEDSPHMKVLPYLIILALIPAVAYFANFWMLWNSEISKATEAAIKYAGNNEYAKAALPDVLARIKASKPFNLTMGIIFAVQVFVTIVGGVYVATTVINELSDQFSVLKNFDRTFSLVVFSYTPLCIAGILYIWPPLLWLVPLLGLYGIYLLYLGVNPIIKPAAEKKTGYVIMASLVTLLAYVIVSKIVPMITMKIYNSIFTANQTSPFVNP